MMSSVTIVMSISIRPGKPRGASFIASCFRYQLAVQRISTSSRTELIIRLRTFLVMEMSMGRFPVAALTSLPFSLRV